MPSGGDWQRMTRLCPLIWKLDDRQSVLGTFYLYFTISGDARMYLNFCIQVRATWKKSSRDIITFDVTFINHMQTKWFNRCSIGVVCWQYKARCFLKKKKQAPSGLDARGERRERGSSSGGSWAGSPSSQVRRAGARRLPFSSASVSIAVWRNWCGTFREGYRLLCAHWIYIPTYKNSHIYTEMKMLTSNNRTHAHIHTNRHASKYILYRQKKK